MITPLELSNRVRHDADRYTGVELILPWPEGVPLGPPLDLDDERDPTPIERVAVNTMIGGECARHDLLIRRIVVARLRYPDHGHAADGYFLVAEILHRRWSGARNAGEQPVTRWHPAALVSPPEG